MEALAILALKALLPVLLTWAAARWDSWVRTKVKNEKLRGLLLHVDDAASTAVLAVGQTYADSLARAAADGKIDKAEAAQAKRLAMDEAKRQMGEEAWKRWCDLMGSEQKAEEGLSARVEAALKRVKMVLPRKAG